MMSVDINNNASKDGIPHTLERIGYALSVKIPKFSLWRQTIIRQPEKGNEINSRA
jgi:hypothetical protein